jgi:histidine ammonia-lyase
MKIRTTVVALGAVSLLALGACTAAEQQDAKSDTAQAGEKAEDVAQQAGEVIESSAMKAAQAVENGAGSVADKLEANQAEAAAEGRPGAVDPNTDQRVPAPAH